MGTPKYKHFHKNDNQENDNDTLKGFSTEELKRRK